MMFRVVFYSKNNIDFNSSDKSDTIKDQPKTPKYGKVICFCKKYCPGKDEIVNDENTDTTVPSKEDYRQQIPGPVPVAKPWESKEYKPERKDERNSNDSTSSLSKKKKAMFDIVEEILPNTDQRNSFKNRESTVLPSSDKDMKCLEKCDTDKNKRKSKQYDTGTITEGNEIDDLGALNREKEAERHRMSLITEKYLRTHGTRDDGIEYESPLSEPQAASSPLNTGPLIRRATTPPPPPTPESTMVNNSYGELK